MNLFSFKKCLKILPMYQWYLHWYHWKEECLLFHFIIVNPFHNYPGFVLQAKSAIFTAKCPAQAYIVLYSWLFPWFWAKIMILHTVPAGKPHLTAKHPRTGVSCQVSLCWSELLAALLQECYYYYITISINNIQLLPTPPMVSRVSGD